MPREQTRTKANKDCTTIIEKLVLHKTKFPEKMAYRFIVKDQESETMTYEELYQRVFSLAAKIKQKAGYQERVILCAEPGFDFVVGFYACLTAGTIAVPVVPPLNKMMANRFLHILNNVQPQLILFDNKISKALNMGQVVNRFVPKLLKSYVGISDTHEQLFKTLKHMSLESLVIDASTDLLLDDTAIDVISRDDVAFIQYTSGSTADPKGVLITHGNLVDNSGIIQRACQTSEETICYSWLPPYHDMGLIAGIIHMMFVGGTGILQSTIDFIERPLRWLEGISKYRCTMTGGPNFAFELCVAKAKSESISTLDLSCLRVAANGAEPINPKTMESFYKTFEPVGLKRHIFLPCYGLAESTVMSSSKVCLTEDTVLSIDTEQLKRNIVELNDDATRATVLVSSGIPMMPLRIVHPEHFVECHESEIGEIWLQGQSVAKGYYNNPEETEKTFKAQIKGDEESGYYLRTGDLGFLHEGQLYVCGRIKNMIIIRGQNYYPHDIELAVAHSDASIRKGCVVAYASQCDNEEVLTVVAEVKAGVSEERLLEIVEHINQTIGQDIHLMAKYIHLVPPRSIPKTTSGKLQRIRCKEMIDEQMIIPKFSYTAPTESVKTAEVQDHAVEGIGPSEWIAQFRHTPAIHQKNAIKTMVLSTIREIVPLHTPSLVDLSRGFFELGIDSIKAVDIKNKLQEQVGDALLLESSLIFNFPNIQAVIDYLYDELRTDKVIVAQEKNMPIPTGLNEDIAIIGMSCHFPRAANIDEFWQLLDKGIDGVQEIPKERWFSEYYTNADLQQLHGIPAFKGGCIDGITEFDASFFSISPREALLLDPQQRLLLMNVWRALENAAYNPSELRGSNAGVFIGISSHDYEHVVFGHKEFISNPYLATGNAASTAAGRVSYALGLQGPSMALDTACSSSLVALHEACMSLRNRECFVAIVGGVNALLSPDLTINLSNAGMLSPDGACKTFDESANGYVRGEGCGVVVLKPLSEAQKAQDRILAIIKGTGINQDGASGGLTVPNGAAQKSLLQSVLDKSGLRPEDIHYIECHGTGTSLGDPIEVGAIGQVYGEHRDEDNPLCLGAVKTNIGHLEAAAGMAGLIKTILAIEHETIPANLHFKALNPHIRLNFPAEIMTAKKAWVAGKTPRRAAISSFGFSGTNAHIIIEEPPTYSQEEHLQAPTPSLFVLSAKSQGSLESLIAAYQAYLQHTEESLSDICYTAAVGRAHFQWRVAIEAESKEALVEALKVVSPVESQMTDESVAEGDLKGAYLEGKRVDWAGYYAPYVRGLKKVSLPTYCFEKTRYWLETTKAKETPGYGEDVHPLLGSQLPGYGEEVRFWQRLNVEESDYLLDHRVYDLVIVPGASMLESALGASHVLDGNERAQVEEMVFEVPLVLTEGQSTSYQVSLHANESGHTGKIYSSTNDNEWVLHARFRVSQAPLVVHPMLDVAALQRRLSPAEVGSLYERLEQVGLNYGKAFHTITEAYVGEQEVLARVQVLDGLSTQGYRVHPTLLDGVFQSMALVASDARLYIPSSIEKVEWFSRSDRSVWAHVQLREGDAQHLTSDIDLYTLDGVCIASIKGLSARAVSRESLRQMEGMRTTLDVYREALEAYELPSEVGCLEQALAYGFTDEERPSTWDEGKTDSDFSQCHVVIQYKAFELLGLVSLVKRAIQSPPLSMTLLLSGAYGEDAAVSAWAREALGFWRSVRQEASSLRLMVIDSESLAEAIAMSNVGQHTLEPEVVLRGSQAYVPRLRREEHLSQEAIHYDPKATYLITGGVGALGRALVEHMIGQGAKHFVLTSRHALDEATQAWCAAHDAQGVEILHAVVDVADKEGLEKVFESIRQNQHPLKGIFHAAGVLHDGLLMQLSDADFNTVLAPKVMGARHLDALSQDESLDYFVMFSSIAGLFGNIGQSNYAAANAYMDGLAKERRRKGLPGLSINFGPFAKRGMASNLAAAHQAQGVVPMTTQAAFALMDQALKGTDGQCAIIDVHWEKMPKNVPYLSHLVRSETPSLGAWYQLLEKTPSAEREAVLVQQLKHMVSDVLQLESSDAIDIHQGFFDLGMDSLMAVELKNKLQQQLGSAVTLSNTLVFDYGSIEKLAGYLLDLTSFNKSEFSLSNTLNQQLDFNHRLATNQQLVFWEQQKLYGDNNVNLCISAVFQLKGKVNLQALEYAISSTIAEHAVFYSQFYLEEGGLKVNLRSDVVPVRVLDVSETDHALNKAFFDSYFATKYLEINKLTEGQLFSFELMSKHEDAHYLLLAIHHILLDAAGIVLLLNRIADRYKQFVNNQVGIIRPPIDYYNYFAKLAIKNPVSEKKLLDWSTHFVGINPVLNLPKDGNDESAVPRIEEYSFTLSADLSSQVIQYSKSINHSTFAVFFGVISQFLSQYTNQTDFALAATFMGRNNDIESEILGLFVQDLIVPIHIHHEETIEENIRHSYSSFLKAYTFADVSNEELFHTLNMKREWGREPLAQVLVLMQNLQYPSSLGALNAEMIYSDTGKFFYDLIFEIEWHSPSFHIILKYKSDRYSKERVKHILSELNSIFDRFLCSDSMHESKKE